MTDRDRLTEMRQRLATVQSRLRNHYFADPDDCVWATEQVDWLLGEVERLREVEADWNRVREELMNAKRANANLDQRLGLKLDELKAQDAEILRLKGLLRRLEWIGGPFEPSYDDPRCPACGGDEPEHAPDCWLADEL